MEAPALERAILRTFSLEDYRDVVGRKAGTYSLLGCLSTYHEQLSLSQELDATPSYPRMKVVDIIPATICCLSEEATLVVLPPEQEGKDPIRKEDVIPAASGPSSQRLIQVILDRDGDSTHHGFASPQLMSYFLVEDGHVMQLGGEATAPQFVFPICCRETPNEGQSHLLLWVHEDLFSNIRRIVAQKSMAYPEVNISYRQSSFLFPADWLSLADSGDGEGLLEGDVPSASKVTVCPAIDDFLLQTLFGEEYSSLFSIAVEEAVRSGWMSNRFVSPGDIICIPMPDYSHGSHTSLSGVDVVELALRTLKHKVSHWDGAYLRQDESPIHPFPLRVCSVSHKGGCSAARLRFTAGDDGIVTEVVAVSQSFSPSMPHISPFFAPQRSGFCETDFKINLTSCLDDCLHARGGEWLAHLLVVQGIPENLSERIIDHTLTEFGMCAMFISSCGLEDTDITLLMEKFMSQETPLALVIRDAHLLCSDSPHLLPLFHFPAATTRGPPKVVILLCETLEAVPPILSSRSRCSGGTLLCGNPSEADRRRALQWAFDELCEAYGVRKSLTLSMDALASWSTGLSLSDILSYATECVHVALSSVSLPSGAAAVLWDGQCEDVLQAYLKAHGHNLVSTKLQPVRWSDVGGLEDAKRELRDTIQLPILHPEIFASGLKKRAGVLFYGPPGCGKTLLAKAVATEMNMNFMSVKGPELINQYVGESERNIRILFQKARDNSPCIVFFDELDALAPARGAKGDAGGAMDRIVSQLLVEVDGVGQKCSDGSEGGQVFIIGATNRPDLLDPALLRPGRFDRLCYLGIPSTKEEQLFAVKALTRKFSMSADVSLEKLIEPLDSIYTGADFFALCSDAMMYAVEELIASVQDQLTARTARKDEGHVVEEDDEEEGGEEAPPLTITMAHFVRAREQLKPSVSREDLIRYESLKAKFSAK